MPVAPTPEQIVADVVVLDEAGRHVPGVAGADGRELGSRGADAVDRGVDVLEGGARLRGIAAGDGRPGDDHERRAVLALVVAVGVVLVAGVAGVAGVLRLLLEPPLDVLDGHRGAVVVEELIGLLGDLVVPAGVDVVAELLELLHAEEQARARQEERPRLLDAVLGARHDVRTEREQGRDEGVAEGAQGRAVGPLEEDHRRLRARRPRLDAVELDDARLAVGQELVVAGAELELRREEPEDDGDERDEQQRHPGAPDLQVVESLDELFEHGGREPRPAGAASRGRRVARRRTGPGGRTARSSARPGARRARCRPCRPACRSCSRRPTGSSAWMSVVRAMTVAFAGGSRRSKKSYADRRAAGQ